MVNLNQYAKEHSDDIRLFTAAFLCTFVGIKMGRSMSIKETNKSLNFNYNLGYCKGYTDGASALKTIGDVLMAKGK